MSSSASDNNYKASLILPVLVKVVEMLVETTKVLAQVVETVLVEPLIEPLVEVSKVLAQVVHDLGSFDQINIAIF